MSANAIIVAGGRGARFGGEVPKQFLLLGGEPLLAWSVRRCREIAEITRIVVVAAPEHFERCERLVTGLGVAAHLALAGAERQDSVRSGLGLLETDCEIVLVHDAARPLVTATAIRACIAAARARGGAILATPVLDTVKRVANDTIVATVPRGDLWLAQTPQAFRAGELRRVHDDAAAAGVVATDDASLFEWAGLPVTIVAGDPRNRKITTPDDLAWAEAVVARAGVDQA